MDQGSYKASVKCRHSFIHLHKCILQSSFGEKCIRKNFRKGRHLKKQAINIDPKNILNSRKLKNGYIFGLSGICANVLFDYNELNNESIGQLKSKNGLIQKRDYRIIIQAQKF